MKLKITALICGLLLTSATIVFSQQTANEAFHAQHSLGLVISHAQVTEGIKENGHKKWLSLPSWGLNYNYKFSPEWAIGLHNDIIVEDFEVEEHLNGESDAILQRSYPIASAVMASYKPGKHFSYLLGTGGEFAHTGSFILIRIGAEYGYEINKHWELNANITNDLKINAYNSWAIGLGITRIF
jgi:hypothetical protein